MSGSFLTTAVLLIFFGSLHIGTYLSLHLDITPAVYDGVSSQHVAITCRPNATDSESRSILVIEIFEKENNLIASVNENDKITHTPGTAQRFQIDGQFHDNTTDSFLRLILLNPKSDDAGIYTCVMFYRTGTSYLNREKVSKYLVVQDTKSVYRRLQQELSYLEEEMEKRKANETEIRGNISVIEEKAQIEALRLENLQHTDTLVTAFSAALPAHIAHTPRNTVVFSTVIMKKGQGYDSKTGIFTAPFPGLYLFYVSMGTEYPGGDMMFDLQVNNQIVASMQVGHIQDLWRDINSMTSVVKLETGDTVKVVMAAGQGLVRPDRISVFGGHCVQAIIVNGNDIINS